MLKIIIYNVTFLLRVIGYYEKNNGSAGGALQNRIIGQKKSILAPCLVTVIVPIKIYKIDERSINTFL